MKFRIKVYGQDSVDDGIGETAAKVLEASGMSHDSPGWDRRFDREARRLRKLVETFIQVGSDDNDAVTVEIDEEEGTCVVVPAKEVKKAEKAELSAAARKDKDAARRKAKDDAKQARAQAREDARRPAEEDSTPSVEGSTPPCGVGRSAEKVDESPNVRTPDMKTSEESKPNQPV